MGDFVPLSGASIALGMKLGMLPAASTRRGKSLRKSVADVRTGENV
jgi:hypothetical protein